MKILEVISNSWTKSLNITIDLGKLLLLISGSMIFPLYIIGTIMLFWSSNYIAGIIAFLICFSYLYYLWEKKQENPQKNPAIIVEKTIVGKLLSRKKEKYDKKEIIEVLKILRKELG